MLTHVRDLFQNRAHRIELRNGRVYLRAPMLKDFDEWSQLRCQSRDFLQPFEPTWHQDEFTRASFKQRLRRYEHDSLRSTSYTFFIQNQNDELCGGITLGNIRYGVAQAAQIGYWMGEVFSGRGYMVEAIGAVLLYAHTQMHLNRIEAACLPNNQRSIRALEKAKFSREGYLRSYLKINGHWRDHLLYAHLGDDLTAI